MMKLEDDHTGLGALGEDNFLISKVQEKSPKTLRRNTFPGLFESHVTYPIS